MATRTPPSLRRWLAAVLLVVALALVGLVSAGEVATATTSRRGHGGGSGLPVGLSGTIRYRYRRYYDQYGGRRRTYGLTRAQSSSSGSNSSGSSSSGSSSSGSSSSGSSSSGSSSSGSSSSWSSASGSSSSGSSSSGTRRARSRLPSPTLSPIPTRPPSAIKINVGGGAADGFAADRGFVVRGTSTTRDWWSAHVYRTAGLSRSLYTSFRSALWSSSFAYSLRVHAGTYTVRLHFAEINRNAMGRGRRIFSVTLEGVRVLSNYDIYRDVGAHVATVKAFTTTVTDGVLDIGFHSVVQNAVVMAIEVHSVPQKRHPPTPSPTSSATPTRAPAVTQAAVNTNSTPIGTKKSRDKSTLTKSSHSHAKKSNDKESARCNVQPRDCDNTREAIAGRYLNKECLPDHKGGKLVATAATLTVAISVIRAHGCCARNVDREKLLRMAKLLASTDTCADTDTMPLPSGVVTTTPHNSTTAPPPSNVMVPSVNDGVSALEFLGTLDEELAPGTGAPETMERVQLTSAGSDVSRQERQQTHGFSLLGRANQLFEPSSARASVVLDDVFQTDDLPSLDKNHKHTCCHKDRFNYNGLGCCHDFCWIVADILPFFTLEECCNDDLKSLKHCH